MSESRLISEQVSTFSSGPLGRRNHVLLFLGILALGIFARTWEFRALPPGLNADEASIRVQADDSYRFGMDRSGNACPVQFFSWGSGQNALTAICSSRSLRFSD